MYWPDPDYFDGDCEKFECWQCHLRIKLRYDGANLADEMTIGCIATRTTGVAFKVLQPRLPGFGQEPALNSTNNIFRSSEEVIDYLQEVFSEHGPRQRAELKLAGMSQGDKERFQPFYTRWTSVIWRVEKDDWSQMYDLRKRLNNRFSEKLTGFDLYHGTLQGLVDECFRLQSCFDHARIRKLSGRN
jgi:hypothetical protein